MIALVFGNEDVSKAIKYEVCKSLLIGLLHQYRYFSQAHHAKKLVVCFHANMLWRVSFQWFIHEKNKVMIVCQEFSGQMTLVPGCYVYPALHLCRIVLITLNIRPCQSRSNVYDERVLILWVHASIA